MSMLGLQDSSDDPTLGSEAHESHHKRNSQDKKAGQNMASQSKPVLFNGPRLRNSESVSLRCHKGRNASLTVSHEI